MSQNQGSLYILKPHQLKLMRGYSELHFLSKAEKAFLMGLVELAQSVFYASGEDTESPTIQVTRGDLITWMKSKGKGSSPTIIKKRSQSFLDYSLFKKETQRKPGTPPIDVFTLQDLGDVISANPKKDDFEDHRPHRKNLTEIREQLVIDDGQILDKNLPVQYARSERLWNGVLGSCMRASFSDNRKTGPYSTIYKFADDSIEIITSAQSDSEIAHINDLRTIRAIMTLVCISVLERSDLNKEIKNEFFVDIVDLCALMGLNGTGANRDTIRKSMERLYSTNFHIVLDSHSKAGNQFIDFFGFNLGSDDLNFRFLTEMDSSLDREYGGGTIRRPRWYRIVLHSKTFQDLLDKEAYSVYVDNKDILKLSSGLLHLLYSWCARRCKRSGNIKAVTTLKKLHLQLCPGARFDNFQSRLVNQLKEYTLSKGGDWFDGAENQTNLFGYKVKLEPDVQGGHTISCWRDKKDPVVGDGSLHNRLRIAGQAPNQFRLDGGDYNGAGS